MGDRELASELTRQNYAFVASFSVTVWDCLITFHQEVNYVWGCSSRVTKYSFLFCRYCALGYFIVRSIFGTQWTLQIPPSTKDCRTWFLVDITLLTLLYVGSQLILIRKVFNLYGKSVLLASVLFAFHCGQTVGTVTWGHHISGSLNFNSICNGGNVPNLVFSSSIGMTTCIQCITWSLILRKVWKVQPSYPRWSRYLLTYEVHTKISCGLYLVAVLFTTSHSFANQRLITVYTFTFPLTILSIGVCRYILRVEKTRDTCSKPAEVIDTDEFKQCVVEQQLPATELDTLPMPQSRRPHSEPQAGGHNFNTAVESNLPYLHGAQSYELKKTRRSMDTTITYDSPRGSSDYSNRQTVSVRTSRSRNSGFGPGPNPQYGFSAADSGRSEAQRDSDETHSASNIEIGSLHSSSSVDSEELRRFYNDTWNVGPFIPGGP